MSANLNQNNGHYDLAFYAGGNKFQSSSCRQFCSCASRCPIKGLPSCQYSSLKAYSTRCPCYIVWWARMKTVETWHPGTAIERHFWRIFATTTIVYTALQISLTSISPYSHAHSMSLCYVHSFPRKIFYLAVYSMKSTLNTYTLVRHIIYKYVYANILLLTHVLCINVITMHSLLHTHTVLWQWRFDVWLQKHLKTVTAYYAQEAL